ncbi:MAG: phosphotransferase, partial [Phycisphaerae bacterium]|nr:phosphotransferase [Phycisphaerae bacterium]
DYGPARRLIEALADLLATAHQRGLQHADLHPENLLVIGDPCAEPRPRIAFVDLHGVQTHRPVSDAAIIRNLAQLNQWFRRHAGITDRIRFLCCYLNMRQAMSDGPLAHPLGLSRKALVKALEQEAHDHAQRLYAKRDRRAMRTNRYFATIRVPGGWRGHVFLSAKRPVAGSIASTLTFRRQQWQTWLTQPLDWLMPDEAWQMIKDSHSGTVCRRTLPTTPTPLPVVCKRPRSRNILRRIVMMLRRSRNLRAWQRGFALIHRNMPTAWPLAVLERRRFGLLLDSIAINEALPDAHDLDAVISLELTRLAPTDQRRAKDLLIDVLCRLVKRMHERHFFHRDFKASNIMIQWAPGFAVPPALSLVDLDGLRLKSRTDNRHVHRALARLNVSLDHCRAVTRTDRLRFLRRFLSGWGRESVGWKALWYELDARSGRKRRQYRQHQAWKLEHYGRT